jgi:hypothetical protein
MTFRTWLSDCKETLLASNFAMTMAHITCHWTGTFPRSGSLTDFTLARTGDIDFFFHAECSFFKRHSHFGLEIISGYNSATASSAAAPGPTASAENIAEDVTENISQISEVLALESTTETTASHLGTVVAKLVVHLSLLIIEKNVSRVGSFFKERF